MGLLPVIVSETKIDGFIVSYSRLCYAIPGLLSWWCWCSGGRCLCRLLGVKVNGKPDHIARWLLDFVVQSYRMEESCC